jgi:hypothetical protein
MADEHMGEREREQSRRMMTGMFRDRESAERAYGAVTGRAYGASDNSNPLVWWAIASTYAERLAARSPARCQYGMACARSPASV